VLAVSPALLVFDSVRLAAVAVISCLYRLCFVHATLSRGKQERNSVHGGLLGNAEPDAPKTATIPMARRGVGRISRNTVALRDRIIAWRSP